MHRKLHALLELPGLLNSISKHWETGKVLKSMAIDYTDQQEFNVKPYKTIKS